MQLWWLNKFEKDIPVRNESSQNTLTKGLTILNLVDTQENPRGVSLGYLSDKLEMSKSTVYRYLTILCASGWPHSRHREPPCSAPRAMSACDTQT